MSFAYSFASLPPIPIGLSSLISSTYALDKNASVNIDVCDKHCNAEFMKHVFPKFCKPAFPRVPCFNFARSVSISFFGDANPKECDVDGNAIGSKVIRFGARSESFAMVMSSSFRAFLCVCEETVLVMVCSMSVICLSSCGSLPYKSASSLSNLSNV